MRVVCAMSGGVDSSVAAALMLAAGHEVVGMTMRLYDAPSHGRGRGGTCCSPAEIDLARRACETLGVPHYTVDERERFRERVIDDFVREYANGRTPNPCARCNEHVKFTPLLARARALGAERLVTGHYARIAGGRLMRGSDRKKDQSYFLFAMGRETLQRVEFPLGEWTKDRVREHARTLGLPNADAPDSQEICFVPDGDHTRIVRARAASLGIDPRVLDEGPIEDTEGNEIGRHAGIHGVTVGQRRGLALAGQHPRYVLRVLPERGAVIVGDKHELLRGDARVLDFRALCDASELPESDAVDVEVQLRHRSPPIAARATRTADAVTLAFVEPASAVAPGQAAVFYRGDVVLGGGWLA